MHNPFEHNVDATNNDVRLIDQALEGNQQALEKLIRRHQAWIYNVAFRMVANPTDAEDITQEILLKVLQSSPPMIIKKLLFEPGYTELW